jgi:thioredoxin 1
MKTVNTKSFQKEVLEKDRVLIDFNAEWCGPCKMLGPILEELSKEVTKTEIVSINVDENEDLAKDFNVFSIPCLVLVEKGKEIDRKVGLQSKSDLKNWIGE